jgi:predicted glycogen debranching enzyme
MEGMPIRFGRAITGDLAAAERREWLSTNGIGGFASGTVAGTLTRRYHGLLVAALAPPLGRTLLATKLDETIDYDGVTRALSTNRWAGGVVDPQGYRDLERFELEGTTPVWTYAIADALVEKRVWMERDANTTYVRYRVLRAQRPLGLSLKPLVNYRDYHATTRADGWRMHVSAVPDGLRVVAFEGARPLLVLAPGAAVGLEHDWYRNFDLRRERERGLDALDDHLVVGTFRATVPAGGTLTVVLSAETEPGLDSNEAWRRRVGHEAALRTAWQRARPPAEAPPWIESLALAADQFLVRRPLPGDPDGMTVIAGYPWFADWGRDAMVSLPGLTLTTGRPEVAKRILTTFARFLDHGLVPNRFPDAGGAPEYNTVDATLWYVQAVRAFHDATGDDRFLRDLVPLLESIIAAHRDGTRYGIHADPVDGLLASGQSGVPLTWMDVKIGDEILTPRTGKAVEVNALWYNALAAMADFARRLGTPAERWESLARRARTSFSRFWNAEAGYCYDVIDGPAGTDPTLRPNQIFAVSLPDSPLPLERQRRIVDVCARHLVMSYGLRSLPAGHPEYRGHYRGDPRARDQAYHEGTAWAWLLGPFALAHFTVYRDAEAARRFLLPLADHVSDYGLGSIAEIFDGDPPFTPAGCIAQAWSVAEALRAWHVLEESGPK